MLAVHTGAQIEGYDTLTSPSGNPSTFSPVASSPVVQPPTDQNHATKHQPQPPRPLPPHPYPTLNLNLPVKPTPFVPHLVTSPVSGTDAFTHRGYAECDGEAQKLPDTYNPRSPSEFDPNLSSPTEGDKSSGDYTGHTNEPAHLQQYAEQRSKELATKQKEKHIVGEHKTNRSELIPTKTLEYKESVDGTLGVPTELITAAHSFPARITSKTDFASMRVFLTSPLPPGVLFQCYILRNRSGIKNRMYPRYELYYEASKTFLLSSKKKTSNKTSNYVISMSKKKVNNHSIEYVGKVRGNFSGSEYICYDDGINPKHLQSNGDGNGGKNVREEIGAVFYANNILSSVPRKLTAVIPSVAVIKPATTVTSTNPTTVDAAAATTTSIQPSIMRRSSWVGLTKNGSIVSRYKSLQSSPTANMSSGIPHQDDDSMTCLGNKTPEWNDRIGAYALNFHGRASVPSVKNFQLIKANQPDVVMLQFGKMGKDLFTLDIQHPMSPLQAFAIALSGVDSKLVCD